MSGRVGAQREGLPIHSRSGSVGPAKRRPTFHHRVNYCTNALGRFRDPPSASTDRREGVCPQQPVIHRRHGRSRSVRRCADVPALPRHLAGGQWVPRQRSSSKPGVRRAGRRSALQVNRRPCSKASPVRPLRVSPPLDRFRGQPPRGEVRPAPPWPHLRAPACLPRAQ